VKPLWPIIEIVLDEKGMSARAYIIELWMDQPSLPSSLAFATKLETLALGLSEVECVWTGTLPESYAAFTALRTLSLSHITGITGNLPSSWGIAMTNLETIDLFRNPKLQDKYHRVGVTCRDYLYCD
jgi:hypothetical protein